MGLLKKICDLLDVPKLHNRIDDLEAQLKARPVIHRDNFYDVAKLIDLEGVKSEIAERIIEEFKPFMERHAIACLKQAFKDNEIGKPISMMAAYDVQSQSVVVNVEMPRLESRFHVMSPRF